MNKLYKFHWDVGRMGSLEGIFVANSEHIDALIGKNIYFGEVLGKHSDIDGELEAEDITVLSDNQDFINMWVAVLGDTTFGYNPLDYYEDEDDD